MATVAGLREFAVCEIEKTLNQAERIMPSQMSDEQLRAWKAETRRYLSEINSIGYSACQHIMGAIDEILSLPSGNK